MALNDRHAVILDRIKTRLQSTQHRDKVARYLLALIQEEDDAAGDPSLHASWLLLWNESPLTVFTNRASMEAAATENGYTPDTPGRWTNGTDVLTVQTITVRD